MLFFIRFLHSIRFCYFLQNKYISYFFSKNPDGRALYFLLCPQVFAFFT
jgi:hypothetical protein